VAARACADSATLCVVRGSGYVLALTRGPPGSQPEFGVLCCSLVLTCSAGLVTVLAEPAPPPPDGAGGRLTQRGARPVMMVPAPSAEPRPGLPLSASTNVSPAGMPPLPHTLTVTERCPFLVTSVRTDIPGAGPAGGAAVM
jgi:hypothetical protein